MIVFTQCTQPADSTKRFTQEVIDTIQIGSTVVGVSVIKSGLNVPWEITWAPDDKIWFTTQDGSVNRMDPETGHIDSLLTIPDYYRKRLALASMVLHPNLKDQPFVFLHHLFMKDSVIFTRLVWYKVNQTRPVLSEPIILIEYPAHQGHNGSRMVIAPDGKLIIATGDIFEGKNAQDTSNLSGKIIRMNIDGSVPDNNPIPGSYIWSLGFRVPQGLVYAGNGKLYSAEHGDATDDEVNLIEKGKNYGFPDITGFSDSANERKYSRKYNATEPLKAWTPTIAPAGMDYYETGAIKQWENSLLLVTLKAQSLRVLKLNDTGDTILNESIVLEKKFGRLRDLCISPDGDIYLSTSNRDWNPPAGFPVAEDDRILRLSVLSKSQLNKFVPKPRSLQEAVAISNDSGKTDYLTYCGSCHKPDGKGVEGSFPALLNSEYLYGRKEKLLSKVLHGGSTQNGSQQMPAFSFLKDKEIAGILHYIRKNFANNHEVITEKEISEARSVSSR